MIFQHKSLDFTELDTIESNTGRQYKTPAGVFPSITTVLGHTGDKQWLHEWRESLGPEAADAEMLRAAERGTAVHDMAEKYLKNIINPMEGHIHNHCVEFNSIRTKLNRISNIWLQEAPLWSSELRLAGRVDCIAEYDGIPAIIDFKTSSTIKRPDMILDYYMQTAAYALMFQERYGIQVDKYVIIMSAERSPVPLVFKGDIDPHIAPLLKRINTYHKQHNTPK